MYGYILMGLGVILLALAAFLRRLAVRVSRREAEEHTRFLMETYGKECCRRATSDSPQEKASEQRAFAGKEVAS